jgi:hypothetical protein
MCSSIIEANLLAAFALEADSTATRLDLRLLVAFWVFFRAAWAIFFYRNLPHCIIGELSDQDRFSCIQYARLKEIRWGSSRPLKDFTV